MDTPLRTETGAKRVRAYLAGRLVADTHRPLLVWESPRYPTYYLPRADVLADLEPATDVAAASVDAPVDGQVCDVEAAGARAAAAALVVPADAGWAGADHVRLTWGLMDAWFEEDEQVHVHPRNPYTRIDALHSSRHVTVHLDGVLLADSHSPVILYETGHPPRHYLPATDVRMDLLERSERVTHCPYKGSTAYYHARVGDRVEQDLAWSYPVPLAESLAIAGRVCFPADRVELLVDGERQQP